MITGFAITPRSNLCYYGRGYRGFNFFVS